MTTTRTADLIALRDDAIALADLLTCLAADPDNPDLAEAVLGEAEDLHFKVEALLGPDDEAHDD